MIIIIEQLLKCRCCPYLVVQKNFLFYIHYLHSCLISVTMRGKLLQGECGCSAEKSYNCISIFLVKSLEKLLVRQQVFPGPCAILA